jgi:hypothetical protein
MNKSEEVERIKRVLMTVAMCAFERAPNDRSIFIKHEIDGLRRAYRNTFRTKPKAAAAAMEFADKMQEWVEALVRKLELSGGVIGRA